MICIVCPMPHYMAWAIQKFIEESQEDVELIAFYPIHSEVPITGVETILTKKVIWISASEGRTLSDLLGRLPEILIVGGWSIPCLNRFAREVRQQGGQVIGICDNAFQLSLTEIIKAIRFRLFLRRKFSGIMVPGIGGKRLMRFYGMPSTSVMTGIYTASPEIFYSGKPLLEREKKLFM